MLISTRKPRSCGVRWTKGLVTHNGKIYGLLHNNYQRRQTREPWPFPALLPGQRSPDKAPDHPLTTVYSNIKSDGIMIRVINQEWSTIWHHRALDTMTRGRGCCNYPRLGCIGCTGESGYRNNFSHTRKSKFH